VQTALRHAIRRFIVQHSENQSLGNPISDCLVSEVLLAYDPVLRISSARERKHLFFHRILVAVALLIDARADLEMRDGEGLVRAEFVAQTYFQREIQFLALSSLCSTFLISTCFQTALQATAKEKGENMFHVRLFLLVRNMPL